MKQRHDLIPPRREHGLKHSVRDGNVKPKIDRKIQVILPVYQIQHELPDSSADENGRCV
jgi:hypothetical protein